MKGAGSVAIRGKRIHRQGRSRSKEAAGARGHAILTAREIDVLSLLARDHAYAGIARRLGISLNTVTSHIKNSYRKLAVHSGAAAVTRAAELGLLRRDEGKAPGR
jgi:LuxR family transcriptional regulator, maltose regulon positive regulatory protein